jgi:hypothetical protein
LNAPIYSDKKGLLDLLQCEPTRPAVAAALAKWGAYDFVDAVLERDLCAAALRSFESIDQHMQGKSTLNISPVSIERIGDAPKRSTMHDARPPGDDDCARPLDGVRVLEMTRCLAGPLAGRTLAVHGADVLFVTSPGLPSVPELDLETTRCKRTTQLDLNVDEDKAKVQELLKEADVFMQGYRPGALDARGLSPKQIAELRPGIVHANLSAFSHTSLYRKRKGVRILSLIS